MQKKGRVLSGMRPTGLLHLGNLTVLRYWVSLQDEYECYYFVPDWHALTTGYEETREIRENIIEIAIDYLAAGIDPGKSTIFLQSRVSEHAILHLLLSMIVPVRWLERNPTYKEWIEEEGLPATYGLLGYPVLQAADILIYRADAVPVGRDQLPHLEIAREIARRFNHLYGKVLVEPEALEYALLPGIDGRKMSKSYDNCIYIGEEEGLVREKVMGMFTDPTKIYKGDPGHPQECAVYIYHSIYNSEATTEIEETCLDGSRGCVACKEELAEKVLSALEPVRSRRGEWEGRRGEVEEILQAGSKKAAEVARETLSMVKEAMKI